MAAPTPPPPTRADLAPRRPQFGAIRQIRLGNAQDTRGTAFVVYEDIFDAKNAVDHLSGFNVCGRYLVVLYYQQTKMQKRLDTERETKELAEMRARLGIDTGDAGADLSSK
jgi:pre-mRNA branch site protein p14